MHFMTKGQIVPWTVSGLGQAFQIQPCFLYPQEAYLGHFFQKNFSSDSDSPVISLSSFFLEHQ